MTPDRPDHSPGAAVIENQQPSIAETATPPVVVEDSRAALLEALSWEETSAITGGKVRITYHDVAGCGMGGFTTEYM